MLRACFFDFKGNLDDVLPLIKFPYDNIYQSKIQIDPYKDLYGRKCISSIGWFEVCEAWFIWQDLVHQDMERVKVI